jgi:hypothetical protein
MGGGSFEILVQASIVLRTSPGPFLGPSGPGHLEDSHQQNLRRKAASSPCGGNIAIKRWRPEAKAPTCTLETRVSYIPGLIYQLSRGQVFDSHDT